MEPGDRVKLGTDFSINSWLSIPAGAEGTVVGPEGAGVWVALDMGLTIKVGGPALQPVEPVAVFYTEFYFTGDSQALPEGQWAIDGFGIVLANDSISSVRVPAGLRVTLFANDNFTGGQVVLDRDTVVLNPDMDNNASAVIIEKI